VRNAAGQSSDGFQALTMAQLLLQLVSRGDSPIPLDVHPDAKILGFTLGISLMTGILFGLAPAFRATRVDLNSVLKGNSRGVVGGTAHGNKAPLGKILVVAQVAMSLLLLIVAGLFVRSFLKLTQVQLGVDRDHLLIFDVQPLSVGYKGSAITQLYKELAARIGAVPGVRAVSFSHNGLFSGSESSDQISIEAYTPKSGQEMNARFTAAKLPLQEQTETTCCYAKSDKAWTIDPQGVAWETFRTLEAAPVYGESRDRAQAQAQSTTACCSPAESIVTIRSRT